MMGRQGGRDSKAKITGLQVGCYQIPTEQIEADGTLEWKATVLVTVHVRSGDVTGVGYTYCHRAAAVVIDDTLKPLLEGEDALDVPRLWLKMVHEIRNLGRPGIVSCAIAAVDTALWDLKAKLLQQPLVKLLGAERESVALYGSGGFTNYTPARLSAQLDDWALLGLKMMKIKIGTNPESDLERVQGVSSQLKSDVALFVDANGAYTRKQALGFAERFAALGVRWFEEPVSSDDLEGLRLLRDRGPGGMAITAGEYGYELPYFERMLGAGAVDVLQADATRCAGITGFIEVAALCAARSMPLSAHTAPAIHAHVCCAVKPLVHLEYFFDHARIENLLFAGNLQPRDGRLQPDLSRWGHGIEFKHADAQRYAI